MGVVGRVSLVFLFVCVVLLPSVSASCGGPFDPPCFVCDNGICEASVDENCNSCPEDCPCIGDEECIYDAGWVCQIPILYTCPNGVCESWYGENDQNCWDDCCSPSCPAQNTVSCNDPVIPTNGCGSCGTYGTYCPPGTGTCQAEPYDCCAPSCPAASTVACGSTYSGSDGCGGSCSIVGIECAVSGEWCFRGSCVECSFPFQCDDQNVCTDDSCTGGDCVNAPVPGRSCTPDGGGAGECDSQGDCVATCTPPLADCDDDGSCETDTNADPSNCGSCGSSCNWDQMCDTGNCVCAYNPVSTYCDTQECGAFTVCGATVDCSDCPVCDTNADCDPGESCCDSECIDTQTDPDNCGACGSTCSGLAPWCVAASCVACRDSNDCSAGETCQSGSCVPSSCVPDCTGKVCGTDGCGGSCGSCIGGQACVGGECSCPDGSLWTGVECEKVVCSDGAIESCYDGPGNTQGVGVCVAGTRTCSNNAWGDCTNQVLPGSESCNGLDDDCDGLVDDGSLCGVGEFCQAGTCTASTYLLVASTGNIRVMEGRWFDTEISIVPETPFSLQTSGFDVTIGHGPPLTLSGMSDSPGQWTLDLEAHHFGLLAQLSIPISVHCNPDNECCGDGEIYYHTDSRPCTLSNGDPGICTEEGCVENCIDSYELRCHDNDIWYFDSCGHPETLSQFCDGVCSVVDGEPTCEPVTTCDNTPYRQCNGNTVEYLDECYVVSIDHVCSANEACEDGGCVPLPPCHAHPGTILCGECINPTADRLNCGGCDRTCESDEQCIDAACTEIPGCVVICDTNPDCHDNELCIHPGDCARSQCQPVNVLEQNQSALLALHELITDGLVAVNVTIDNNRFVFRVTNLAATTLENVSITAAFNKLITASATNLRVEGVNYVIIEDDPVVAFALPTLESTATFTVSAPRGLTSDDLALVTILKVTYADLLNAWNQTKDALTIGLNTEFDGEDTTFHLTLNPDKTMDGVSVPIEIPKCMAEYASEMLLRGTYNIIKEDPLIVWQFDQLTNPTEIIFSVPGDTDEECKAQLKAMAIANRIGKPLNPWLALLLIPAISITLIFFQRFTPDTIHHERMKKAEYRQIGKAQGMNDDEIKRAWKDYKRRF